MAGTKGMVLFSLFLIVRPPQEGALPHASFTTHGLLLQLHGKAEELGEVKDGQEVLHYLKTYTFHAKDAIEANDAPWFLQWHFRAVQGQSYGAASTAAEPSCLIV
jgi:hypothetical protein